MPINKSYCVVDLHLAVLQCTLPAVAGSTPAQSPQSPAGPPKLSGQVW